MDQPPPQDSPSPDVRGDAPRPKHDPGLRRLFSHRRMMADVLRLLPGDLTEGLDRSTLRRLPAEHVGEALRSRRSDMPWRIDFLPSTGCPSNASGAGNTTRPRTEDSSVQDPSPLGPTSPLPPVPEHPGTCVLLLEFQSTVDPRMAERMLEYAALLRGDLSREGKVRGPGDGPPPLLPLVVYNGRRSWTAPVDLGGGASRLPPGLAAMQPRFTYALLEVRRFEGDALALGLQAARAGVNFALAQFALENASAEALPAAMAAVARLLGAEGELGLAESFGMWVEGVLERRLGVRLPSLTRMMEEPPMLEETLDEWAEEKFRLGQAEGMKWGIQRERALLIRQAQRRFGTDVAEALSKLVGGVDDPDRLAEVGDLVVDCATGRELLECARRT